MKFNRFHTILRNMSTVYTAVVSPNQRFFLSIEFIYEDVELVVFIGKGINLLNARSLSSEISMSISTGMSAEMTK